MGQLARQAIAFGRKIPLATLELAQPTFFLDSFSRRALHASGYLEIAEQVVAGGTLDGEQVERLLSSAPTAVLMKLVELRCRCERSERPAVIPAVLLPLHRWLIEQRGEETLVEFAREMLNSLPYGNVEVAIDYLDSETLDDRLISVMRQISQHRGGVQLVAPALDELLLRHARSAPHEPFEEFLRRLRQAGIFRFRTSSVKEPLPLLSELGFEKSILTDLSLFPSHRLLAEELVTIAALAERGVSIEAWTPGYCADRRRESPRALTDFLLLRVMAVGSIVLRNVRGRRASTRYFSAEGIALAKHFGANDFGYGAVDASSAKALDIPSFETLHKLTESVLAH